MKDWLFENHTPGYGVAWKVSEVIHTEKTPYQELSIVKTIEWGTTLVLDGNVQTTEKDEFMYHEMMAHIAMNSKPNVKRVLIVGGGDGGVAKELLKYDRIQEIDLVEIDERVVINSQKYFPVFKAAFDDPRLKLTITDAIEYVKTSDKEYDLVIIDSSDPIGPAIGLYSLEFYQNINRILAQDGMMVAQSESPIFYQDIFQSVYRNIQEVYPIAKVYLGSVPTYVAGPWSFTVGSKKYDPAQISGDSPDLSELKYYNRETHMAAFCLPPYIKKLLGL